MSTNGKASIDQSEEVVQDPTEDPHVITITKKFKNGDHAGETVTAVLSFDGSDWDGFSTAPTEAELTNRFGNETVADIAWSKRDGFVVMAHAQIATAVRNSQDPQDRLDHWYPTVKAPAAVDVEKTKKDHDRMTNDQLMESYIHGLKTLTARGIDITDLEAKIAKDREALQAV